MQRQHGLVGSQEQGLGGWKIEQHQGDRRLQSQPGQDDAQREGPLEAPLPQSPKSPGQGDEAGQADDALPNHCGVESSRIAIQGKREWRKALTIAAQGHIWGEFPAPVT